MSAPIRVLHLITGLNTGGAEMALSRMLETLDRGKFDSRVVSMIVPGPVGDYIRSLGFSVDSLEMPPGRATLKGLLKIFHLLREYRPHILQTWLYHADFLGLMAGKLAGVPAIAWNIRGSELNFMNAPRLSRIIVTICAALSNWPQAVVVNSLAGKVAHIKLGYHPRGWYLIPNGIDTARFSPDQDLKGRTRNEWNIPSNVYIVGMVARLDPQKGHEYFLRAAKEVVKTRPDVHFVCVGSGMKQFSGELKDLALSLGLQRHVTWTGPRTDMPAVYNAFDLTVSSSAYGEGFPNVIAEAMACGIPCISTNTGDSQDILAGTGVIVPPRDYHAMAAAVLNILNMPAGDRTQLGMRARQRIMTNFSVKKMAQSYSDFYQQLSTIP